MAWYNPDDPTQRNWMLGGLAMLVLIVPFNIYLLGPRNEANVATAAEVERLETVNRRASVLSAQGGGDLEARLALYERHVARLEALVPASEEVGVLLDDIQARARQVGVEVVGLDPEPVVAAGPYDRRAFGMTVIGDYHAVGRFLTGIANLSRIVTPVQLDLAVFAPSAQYPEMTSPVRATFRVETYVFANRPAQPAAAQVGGGA
ncbi:MAG: type 4a pilus biogenesis protein PilO [Gemmatimonadota bacterium]|nr:type 4a pilus biogenesis protein PilO [Gemmatimonadota bacterium]MDH3423292.1 type 4a pilus biogenesis protein PilO [Gemmatimonadota bacterium]